MVSPLESMMVLAVAGIYLVPLAAFCKIVQRLGWHWALGLLMLVPLVNIVLICIFAWSDPPPPRVPQSTGRPTAIP